MKINKYFLMTALLLLQWNAQGMSGHGQELIIFFNESSNTYHLICIQETWYNDDRSLDIPNYICLSRIRKHQQRGGCVIYIREKIIYDSYASHESLELQRICIYHGKEKITIINCYNPCKNLNEPTIERIFSYLNTEKYILVGDFNAHSSLWGSEKADPNGKIIETVIDKYNSVLINDGSGTRIDTHTGKISHLDLSIVSPSLASISSWNVEDNTLGSDHFLVSLKFDLKIGKDMPQQDNDEELPQSFKNFNWQKFNTLTM